MINMINGCRRSIGGLCWVNEGSARPEVRGTAEPHGGAYPPCSTPPSYVLTSIILTTLRTDRQRPIVKFLTDADAFAHHFGCSLKPRECYNRGPRTASSTSC